MALTQTQVSQLYVAILGRASEGSGNTFWQNEDNMVSAAEAMLNSEKAQDYFGESLNDSQDFIVHIYENTLGKTIEDDAEGIAYWVSELDGGKSRAEVIAELIIAAQDPENAGDAQDQFNNKVLVSDYAASTLAGITDTATFADFVGFIDGVDATAASVVAAQAEVDAEIVAPIDPEVPGETFRLTADADTLTGTANNDFFDAGITQNPWAGGVSNTLSTAADLDGGAGTDTLYAELVPEFFGVTGDNQMDVQPSIKSIEDIQIEAMDTGNADAIVLDAKDITDVVKIGSAYSDGDLTIENLTTLTSDGTIRNTEAITITMDHTDNFDSDNDASDLTVLFDEDYLLSGQTSQASANYFLLDEDAELNGNANRLNRINVDGIRFVLGDADPTDLTNAIEISDPATLTAGTHDAFVAALQDELQALIADGTLSAGTTLTVNPNITDTTGLDDGSISNSIPAIVLTSGDGTTVTPIGYSQVEDILGNYDVYGQFSADSQTAINPVTVNVELEKAGRDGEGGNLVIGGKSNDAFGDSDKDQTDGIAVFEIAVNGDDDQPSNLGTVSSTNQALTVVNISDHADWDGADLTIRDVIGGGQELTLINSTGFSGDFSLAMSTALTSPLTFTSQMALTTRFGSGDDSYDWMSVEADAVSSGKDYSISMGSGDDTVMATLDGDSVDALGETFTLDAGAGNDTVALDRNDGGVTNAAGVFIPDDGVSQRTMMLLDNIDINLGAGDDTLDMDNDFNANIDAGAGDDLVYINTGDAVNSGTGGAITIGQSTAAQNFASRVLYNAELTITYAGFEQTVDINTISANNFVGDQTTINQAVMDAIDSDPVLSKLLTYTLNDGTQMLTITPTYEGQNSFGIAIYQPTLVDAAPTAGQVVLSAGDLSALEAGFIQTTTLDSDDFVDVATAVPAINGLAWEGAVNEFGVGDDTIYTEIQRDFEDTRGAATDDILDDAADNYVDYTLLGTDSATGFNLSTIEMGAGDNDIVVMHSNDINPGVLKFTGTFGKVSVVNWHDNATHTITNANQMGFNATDFTTLLDNQTDPSLTANTNSAVDVAVTTNIVNGLEAVTGVTVGMNNNNIALANSVNVIRFNEDVTNSETFENLTASTLIGALNNGGTAYGNIQDNTLNANITDGGIVIGGTAKHIIMVENSTNEGEYKIFYVQSDDDSVTNANGDFTLAGASELGVADFGASINVLQVGSVTHTSLVNNLAAAIDAGAATFTYDLNGDGTVAGGEGITSLSETPVDPTNQAPVIEDQTFSIDENSVAGTVVDTLSASDADGDDLTYSTLNQIFAINPATGEISVADGAVLDFETTPSYVFNVRVSDGTAFDIAEVTVNLNDVEETGTPTTTQAVDATSAAAALSAADADVTFAIAQATYTQEITNFAAGDVLDFPVGNNPTVNNTSFTDGAVDVQFANAGTVTTIHLTGLDAADDVQLNGVADFDAVFGAGTII